MTTTRKIELIPTGEATALLPVEGGAVVRLITVIGTEAIRRRLTIRRCSRP